MNVNNIEKYVINLKRRTDRFDHISGEMKYIGWDFNLFEAVDTSSYKGCAYSHIEVAKIAKEKGLDYVMVLEDDVFFMPYAKQLLTDCLKDLEDMEWDLFHFAPSIHRPLTYKDGNLVNLSGPHPPKLENHRGIYGTSAFIYKASLFDEFPKWSGHKDYSNPAEQKPIDIFCDEYIYPNFKCYCPKLPIVTQKMDFSTVNNGVWNTHYIMTYNWKAYINKELPNRYLEYQTCLKERNENG